MKPEARTEMKATSNNNNNDNYNKNGVVVPKVEAIERALSQVESLDDFFGKEGVLSQLFARTLEQMLEMGLMDRYLFAGHFFHGHLMTAEFRIRAWALFHNFRPFCPRAQPYKDGFQSRTHRLNGFVYHHLWLHNLLISSFLARFRH